MGWLFLNPHPLSPKQYLDAQFTYQPDPDRGRTQSLQVVKSTLRGTTYYAACELIDTGKAARTIGDVAHLALEARTLRVHRLRRHHLVDLQRLQQRHQLVELAEQSQRGRFDAAHGRAR